MHLEIRDENTHNALQTDLAEHLWARRGMAAAEEEEEDVWTLFYIFELLNIVFELLHIYVCLIFPFTKY